MRFVQSGKIRKIGLLTCMLCNLAFARQYVFVLHGLGRTRISMSGMGRHLSKQGFQVRNWGYPSQSEPIDELAGRLKKELKSIPADDTVSFVTHSMGGIVVRALGVDTAWRKEGPFIYRVVMIAPPNKGSEKADFYSSNWFSNWVMGPALAMLRSDSASFVNRLPPPDYEVGVIAGAKGRPEGYSKRLPGEDDGKVSVSSAKMSGIQDFVIVKSGHTFIMNKPEVRDHAVAFLKTGRFRKPEQETQKGKAP